MGETEMPEPGRSPEPAPPPFARQAATCSWLSALTALSAVTFGSRVVPVLLMEAVTLVFLAIGLVLGVVALCGIRRHGVRGIAAPAAVGLLLNGLLLSIFVASFLAAVARSSR